MSIRYLILSGDAESARDLSREWYRISRPALVRAPDDVTEFFSDHIVHPTTGEVALFILDEDMPVHAAADGAALAALTNGRTNAADKAQMRGNVAARRGARTLMTDIYPASINGDIKSEAFMEAQGWFDRPEIGS